MLGRNGERIAELMTELETNGRFELTKEEFNKIRRSGLAAGTSDHPNRLEMIESLWVTNHRMIDPQTADCLYTGTYLHPVGVKTLCWETVQAVKFPASRSRLLGKRFRCLSALMTSLSASRRKRRCPQILRPCVKAVAAFAKNEY